MKYSLSVAIAFAALLSSSAFAQFTNRSSVLDGSGTTATGGGYTNLSAAGQPGGISVSDGGAFVNQAGFLNTFFIRGGLDTDGDGLADEADLDNDNDGLRDTTEIAGSAFTPATITPVNSSDSDSDGMNDGREALDGSDPTDPNASFEFLTISNAPAGTIAFVARGNNEKKYVVKASTTTYSQPTEVLFSNTVAGGTAPWYQVTNAIVDSVVTNGRYYSVEISP